MSALITRQGHSSARLAHRNRSYSSPVDVAIVGGGLAGLGAAFHLLRVSKQQGGKEVLITIYDRSKVGKGGASAVAGGLLHPLSPRGKLVHWGLEGLISTNDLVERAARHVPSCKLRDKLYRVALTDKNVIDMKTTASNLSNICRWLDKNEMDSAIGTTSSCGGLELSNGCRVLHVPSYLEGLLVACQQMGSVRWELITRHQQVREISAHHNCVIFAGGAGMIQDEVLDDRIVLPIELVRGQSLEMRLSKKDMPPEAALCGKYISPMIEKDRLLIGATHEFGPKPLGTSDLFDELKGRTYDIAPAIWDNSTIERVTCGWRVQSRRTALGRVPIVGCLSENEWIFTGLSSRGLLYHSVYGEMLANMILSDDEGDSIVRKNPHLNWWR